MKGKVPYWITGPWETSSLTDKNLDAAYGHFKIIQVPKIFKSSVPFLGIQGASISKFAADARRRHDRGGLRRQLPDEDVRAARTCQGRGSRSGEPAAGKLVHDKVLAQFGAASKGGVPLPNIPQMNSVWCPSARHGSTRRRAGAPRRHAAFSSAAQQIKIAIGC